jgi:hypothetical protein
MPLHLTMKRQFAPAVDEPAIASFEAMIGFRLPSEYRDFLLQFNGGQPENLVFRWGLSGGYTDSSVHYFFSITDQSIFSLQHQYSIYASAGRIPEAMLPIATDAGGNLFLLTLGGSHSGRVFFWDHDNEGLVDNSASVETLIPLANSFQEFCEKLTRR